MAIEDAEQFMPLAIALKEVLYVNPGDKMNIFIYRRLLGDTRKKSPFDSHRSTRIFSEYFRVTIDK